MPNTSNLPPRPAPFRGRFHTARIQKRSWERTASVVVDRIDLSLRAYAAYLTEEVGKGYTVGITHSEAIDGSNRRFLAWLERATAWTEAHNRRAKARLAKRKRKPHQILDHEDGLYTVKFHTRRKS